MSTAPRRKPGRTSTVASHPKRREIELARAAGASFDVIAREFGVHRASVQRHWSTLHPEVRHELANEVAALADARSRELAAGLAILADRHPAARADIQALARQLQRMPAAALTSPAGGRHHAR